MFAMMSGTFVLKDFIKIQNIPVTEEYSCCVKSNTEDIYGQKHFLNK